jgi:hypothetical protein
MGKITSRNTLPVNTIADTDIFLISKDNGDGTFTSYKVTGSQMKSNFKGLSNFTEGVNTTSPNNTVNVTFLSANTSSTNGDISIVPKGTGAFILDVPDNTANGGNKRGTGAVDLQMSRTYSSWVASGNYSAILGGRDSQASGTGALAFNGYASGNYSICFQSALGVEGSATNTYSISMGGRANATGGGALAMGLGWPWSPATASGDQSISISSGGVASGIRSTVLGGDGSVANGTSSYAFGSATHVFGIAGRQVRGHAYNVGLGVTQGSTQKSEFYLSNRTTNTTTTTLTVQGGAASNSNQVILSNQSAFRFKGTIIGKQSGSTNAASWDIDGLIVRGANAASTVLINSTVTTFSNTPGWGTPTLVADTTNGGLKVDVIGAASTNIQWTAVIETTEVIYA